LNSFTRHLNGNETIAIGIKSKKNKKTIVFKKDSTNLASKNQSNSNNTERKTLYKKKHSSFEMIALTHILKVLMSYQNGKSISPADLSQYNSFNI